jgi:hypothetical protein
MVSDIDSLTSDDRPPSDHPDGGRVVDRQVERVDAGETEPSVARHPLERAWDYGHVFEKEGDLNVEDLASHKQRDGKYDASFDAIIGPRPDIGDEALDYGEVVRVLLGWLRLG